MKHTRKARIGIIGMGHFIYWPQFDGLKEELGFKNIKINRDGGYGLIEILAESK